MAEGVTGEQLFNNPDFQQFIVDRADAWFPVERLLTTPTVVFDRGSDDFWTTVTNSPKRDALISKVRSNDLIPVNADALGDIANTHVMLHAYLSESGSNIPTIPTVTRFQGNVEILGKHSPQMLPNIYVAKRSYSEDGSSLAHRGRGVNVLRITDEDLPNHLPRDMWEFLQPFVAPPSEYVRDVRVYMVNGKPVTGLVRRARNPLRRENFTGEVVPDETQFPSAQCKGVNEPLFGELRGKVFHWATEAAQTLDRKVRSLPNRPYSSSSTFGFGSIDFLLDSNGFPLPVDFDINPSISSFGEIQAQLAQAMAVYLHELSNSNGLERQILLIGSLTDGFTVEIVRNLQEITDPKRIRIQQPIAERALSEFGRR